MSEHKNTDRNRSAAWAENLKRNADQLFGHATSWFSFLRSKTEDTRLQLKEVFYTTSDQVLEKAEETRKSVKLRLAMLEIEHHLNRLYPQIGKVTCDLAASGRRGWPKDEGLKSKVDLAEEYRQRLAELKQELHVHQKKYRASRG